MDVAGHNKLKDKPLANILLGTEDTKHSKFYQYLYPSLTPSDQLFSQYSSSGEIWGSGGTYRSQSPAETSDTSTQRAVV